MLLLIENSIPNRELILECIDSSVTIVFFDYQDTFDTIASKIPEKKYKHMAILQKQNNLTYSFLNSFGQSILQDMEYLDPSLESWTSFSMFLELCMSQLEITTLDLIGCIPSSLDYASRVWNLPFRYSEKDATQLTVESFRECPLLSEYFTRISPVPQVPPVPQVLLPTKFTQRNIMNRVIHKPFKY